MRRPLNSNGEGPIHAISCFLVHFFFNGADLLQPRKKLNFHGGHQFFVETLRMGNRCLTFFRVNKILKKNSAKLLGHWLLVLLAISCISVMAMLRYSVLHLSVLCRQRMQLVAS
uniref:Uncharacterized protein n=1 Tax=Arundo donax TaxID=35708 RepID=A0A0A9DPH9_ARUDO